jgi:hypothetical protein
VRRCPDKSAGNAALTIIAGRGRQVRPGGHLVFETRDPGRQAWLRWIREHSYQRVDIADVGWVQSWHELLDVSGDLVTFRSTTLFEVDGEELVSRSTLRFRGRDEIGASLSAAGFTVEDVLDAPDRPGLEWVFVARLSDRGAGQQAARYGRAVLEIVEQLGGLALVPQHRVARGGLVVGVGDRHRAGLRIA